MINPVGLEALSDLKLVADGPLRFRAIHLCHGCVVIWSISLIKDYGIAKVYTKLNFSLLISFEDNENSSDCCINQSFYHLIFKHLFIKTVELKGK